MQDKLSPLSNCIVRRNLIKLLHYVTAYRALLPATLPIMEIKLRYCALISDVPSFFNEFSSEYQCALCTWLHESIICLYFASTVIPFVMRISSAHVSGVIMTNYDVSSS